MRSASGSGGRPRLLLIDRDPAVSRVLNDSLAAGPGTEAAFAAADSGCKAADILRSSAPDVVVADLATITDIAPSHGEALARLVKLARGALIVATAEGMSVSVAVEAMQAGAHDFIAKPFGATGLFERIDELARRHGKSRAMAVDLAPAALRRDFEGFVGRSAQMQFVFEQIERVAPSAAPVFITGESGTGKELCAEALHRRSPRAGRPFIALNCGAIPRDLMESELFGSIRGAFTGAHEDRKGAAELADGGTLFLDEIGELDLSLQTKLLRFVQTGTVTRIGDGAARPVDVRVVCATNRNPMHLIAERLFREDLFYRLHVLPIHLPPLRQRPADILPLAWHYLASYTREERKRFREFRPETEDMLLTREWPGNVRQLQNLIRRIVVMFDGDEVTPRMVSAADIEAHSARTRPMDNVMPKAASPILPMWRQEQRIIEEALERFDGNIARAAAALEISPSTIYRKKQSWDQQERGAA